MASLYCPFSRVDILCRLIICTQRITYSYTVTLIQTAYTLRWTFRKEMYLFVTTQRCQTKYLKLFCCKLVPFATWVNDTCGAPWIANISENFRKNLKRPYGTLRGLGRPILSMLFYICSMVYFYMFYPKSREEGNRTWRLCTAIFKSWQFM
jgi:hypothetical protein